MHIALGLGALLLVASLAATPAQHAAARDFARPLRRFTVAFFVVMMALYYCMYNGYI